MLICSEADRRQKARLGFKGCSPNLPVSHAECSIWIKILVFPVQVNRDSFCHSSIQYIKNKPQSNSVGTYLVVKALCLARRIKNNNKILSTFCHSSFPTEYNKTTTRRTENSYRWNSQALTVRSVWTHWNNLPPWFVKLNWLLNKL